MHGLSTLDFPENGWEDIVKAFPSNTHFQFNISHIVTYFITCSVTDGKAAGDLKSMNKSAENLFTCGHVQSIQVYLSESYLYVKAKCLPEMRKDRIYLLKMALESEGNDIVFSECRCLAGKGPRGSCKHIAALSYALSDFSRLRTLPTFQTCTDQLQQWNQPRGRHVNIIPAMELGSRRRELLPTVKRTLGSGVIFDPRPPHLRGIDTFSRIERLRCDLQDLQQPCGFLNIIIPSTEKVQHDHTYSIDQGLRKR